MQNQVGILASLQAEKPCFGQLRELDLAVCQLVSWSPDLWTTANADKVRAEAARENIRITAFWAGWTGPAVWDFIDGPLTLGLVPSAYRAARVESMKRAGTFARELGVPAVITHLGFIPENPSDQGFCETVAAVRHIARFYERLGVEFWFETGQETPVTMLRLIQAVGTPNLGINLDPANLILYGKGSPVDALDVFGPWVRNIHAKDGLYPTDPLKLGHEVKVGQGRVRFPEFVRRLNEIEFKGEFIIEREISGGQQRRDIAETITYLRSLLAAV